MWIQSVNTDIDFWKINDMNYFKYIDIYDIYDI